MASGTGGQIALVKAGSLYNTIDSVDLWTNFVSESIEHTLAELEEGSIQGRRDAPPSYKGIDHGAGNVVMEPNPNALGNWMAGAFGTVTNSLITAAGSTGANSGYEAGKPLFYHQFVPRQAAYSDRSFLQPYGLMVYRDTGSAFMLNGTIFTGLEFNIQANQLVKTTATVMGREMRRIQRTAAISSLVSSGGKPWLWDMASIEVSTDTSSANLAANVNFEQLTLNFTTPHEGVILLDGTKFYAEFQPNDFRRCNISGTLSFRDQTEYDAFIAYADRRMRISILNVNSNYWIGNPSSVNASAFLGYYGLRFHIPAMKYLTWSAPIGGPNRIQASFTAKAQYDDTAGNMISAELFNVTSSY